MNEAAVAYETNKEQQNVLLAIENLNVHYRTRRGPLKAVRNVNLEIRERENVAIIGESGSGKSTFGLAVARLLPVSAVAAADKLIYTPPGGRVLDIANCSDEALRLWRWKEVAVVMQAALSAFNPVLRIRDQFADTARAHGIYDRALLEKKGLELCELVQLEPRRVLDAYPHELSGGMRQRVLIALALLLDPKLVILDEPTTALDILTQRIVIELLRDLKTKLDLSMVLVSHDLSLAAELADRVVTMYAGEFVEVGPVNDIFYKPRHPYTQGLISGVPTIEGEIAELASIPGSPPDLIDLPRGCKFQSRCQYVTDLCRTEEPVMEPVESNSTEHTVACLRWREINDAATHN
ncbi:MAG: ABC transporter ATP-binding protein [Firmicutes bacterium]|nr:ABC transporter ATP-binding protein [Bacillota bacterium]